LVIVPFIGGVLEYLGLQAYPSIHLVVLLLLLPIFIISFISFPFIYPIFTSLGVNLGGMGFFSSSPTPVGYFVWIAWYIIVAFLIVKIIDMLRRKIQDHRKRTDSEPSA